jgi:transcriptional antiterminator
MKAYPVKMIYEEMAFIAMHFHWSHAELLRLEHHERRRWCSEISAVNRVANGTPVNPFDV